MKMINRKCIPYRHKNFISFIALTILIFPTSTMCEEPVNKSDNAVNCDEITTDSPWEAQNAIHPCHYTTHTHPRQRPRKNRTEMEMKEFHNLALFNIRYDLDFQEAGDPCSVRLQQEWLLPGTGGEGNNSVPVPLSQYSFNRIWYKRLCNFFSYLECIPREEVRDLPSKKGLSEKHAHERHKHAGALQDAHNHPTSKSHQHKNQDSGKSNTTVAAAAEAEITVFKTKLNFSDSGRETLGLYRLKIGGRGPGKGRHKSGRGTSDRVDPSKLLGLPVAIPAEGYSFDGVCVCSFNDPDFPDRKRPDYGMDFVEDEARQDWCVAAPGNLCGRVYFKKNLWPVQGFEFSDHIGCPKMYKGDEYECIRWQPSYHATHTHGTKPKKILTSTCEKKQEDPVFLKEAKKAEELKAKRKNVKSKADGFKTLIYSRLFTKLALLVIYLNSFFLS